MANKIEDIYADMVVAIDEYATAMEGFSSAYALLKSAEKKLQSALNDFTEYMGEASGGADSGLSAGAPFSLFTKYSESNTSIEKLFDIGSWF